LISALASSGYLYPYGVDNSTPCPFCALPPERVLSRNGTAIAFRDAYPVSPGHTLVIPLRHVASFFDTSPEERASMLGLLDAAKQQLESEFGPDAYNIGINDGPAAGQTVGHLHIHLIPRYPGDRPDPRGGIRWVIPEKADYWTGLYAVSCGT
jgi:diadenosine tetraphosphate (Ap4A) HIT family hydrolase